MTSWDDVSESVTTAAPAPSKGGMGWDDVSESVTTPKEPRTFSQRLGDTASSTYQGLKSAVTGNDRREFDYPELPSSLLGRVVPKQGALGPQISFARSDAGKLDILAKFYPDIAQTAKKDKFGNTYVMVEGKPSYLNRPGLSMGDVGEAGAATVATLPAALVGGPMYAGAALPLRALGSGTVAGLGSVSQDIVSRWLGSKQPLDEDAAVASFIGGAAFEAATPAVRAIWQGVVGKPQFYDQATGRLTMRGIEALKRAGIDPNDITDDMARQFGKLAADAANPEDAARLASARSLPNPVRQSRGDITGSPRQQMTESLMEKGTFGGMAENQMRSFRAGQQDDIRGNIPLIQGRLSGGQPQVTEARQGGQIVSNELNARAAAANKGVRAAYDAAESKAAYTTTDGLNRISGAIKSDPQFINTSRFSDKARTLMADFDGLISQSQGDDVAVKKLFDWRRDVSTLANAATDQTEKLALTRMLRNFDAEVPKLVDDALLRGDEGAVRAWQRAVKIRAAYGRQYQGGDIIEALTETVKEGGKSVLKVDPNDAATYILTANKTGFINKKDIVRDLTTLKGRLSPDSWNALREEVFLRLAQSGEGAYQGAARDFSGVNFKKAWDNLNMQNPQLARTIFADDERKVINQFANVAASSTGKVRGGDNYSNTAVAHANIVQKLMDTLLLGQKGRAWVARLPFVGEQTYDVLQGARAFGATNPSIRKPTLPPGTPAFGGTIYGTQDSR